MLIALEHSPTQSLFLVFYSKPTATGARQSLSTGHRKQQDFLLWTLPPWTLVAQIKSLASISGQCASCKAVSGCVRENRETIGLTAEQISHVVHTSTEDSSGPVARYLLCLSTKFKTTAQVSKNVWGSPLQINRVGIVPPCCAWLKTVVHFKAELGPKSDPVLLLGRTKDLLELELLLIGPGKSQGSYIQHCPSTSFHRSVYSFQCFFFFCCF